MHRLYFLILLYCLPGLVSAQAAEEKLRVLVLSDIENEPDDAESLVRFLLYANRWDVEGLIATTSVHQKDKVADWRMHDIVTAYGKVRNNLLLHEQGYPAADYLHSIIKKGSTACGMAAVGKDKDSEGSDWIIAAADKQDSRPLWITVWGGSNCLAQALWKVRMTRTPEALSRFVARLRVYTISDQDDSGPWLRKTFPDLFYIVSPGQLGAAYHYSTWAGISGDAWYRFNGPDSTLVSNQWLAENIRTGHGALGAEYPAWKGIMEGDTPSFLYLIDNGLGNPEHPDWGSWGGRYELYTPRYRKWFYEPETRPIWTNAEDEVKGTDGNYYISDKATIWRWRSAYQNDFAARMDWCVKPYRQANHPPMVRLAHGSQLTVHTGDTVRLNASGSTDPDKDQLVFGWMQYEEPGSYGAPRNISIQDNSRQQAYFIAPRVLKPETIHIILSVTDNGKPALTRYQRVVVSVISH
jgi:hypothetical protein